MALRIAICLFFVLLGGTLARTISGRGNSFCYLQTALGQVYCAGYNYGNFGTNQANLAHPFPVKMLGVTKASDIAMGELHTCIVDSGSVRCAGLDLYGQLGQGFESTTQTELVQVVGLNSNFARVEIGYRRHTCALSKLGGLKCWGRDTYGQLGDGPVEQERDGIPVSVLGYEIDGVVDFSLGADFTCIATAGGEAKCTGSNSRGQLGVAQTMRKSASMTLVESLNRNIVAIAAGYRHACALNSQGGVMCWGENSKGELGIGSPSKIPVLPTQPIGMASNVKSMSITLETTYVILSNDLSVKWFGMDPLLASIERHNDEYEYEGGLEDDEERSTTTSLDLLLKGKRVVEIQGQEGTVCIRTDTGAYQCTGVDSYGQLGNGPAISDAAGYWANVLELRTGYTYRPTNRPSQRPTMYPTKVPTTSKPTVPQPTRAPSTAKPTFPLPTNEPTQVPTKPSPKYPDPTAWPTRRPSPFPTKKPTKHPTVYPTRKPSRNPTLKPTKRSTAYPTQRSTNKG